MHAADSFHHHKRMLLMQGTEGSYDGRHSHGRPFRSCSRERRHGESKDIGTDFCDRIMASSRSSQPCSITLSIGRSRDPCLNRLHDAYIDSPLSQTQHERGGDKCLSDARIGSSDKYPSWVGIVSLPFGSLHKIGIKQDDRARQAGRARRRGSRSEGRGFRNLELRTWNFGSRLSRMSRMSRTSRATDHGRWRAFSASDYRFRLSQFHTCPDTSLSCARCKTVLATSSRDGVRPNAWSIHLSPAGIAPSDRPVFCQPGKRRFTRTLLAPHSRAAVCTRPMRPAFDAA